MESPGNKLREARTARSLSLEDIANVTRIPRSSLEHIEEGRFERLPAPVFVRGFIRNYARAVGLEPAAVVRLYDLTTGEGTAEAVEPDGAVAGRARAVSPVRTSASSAGGHYLRGGYAVLGVVVIGLIVAAFALVGDKKAPADASAWSTPTPVMHERIDGIQDIGAETPIRLR